MNTGNFAQKHKHLLQSIAVFPSWLLMIYAGVLFIPALFLLTTSEKILSISTIITLASLFILGLFTVREKKWSFAGWVAFTIALGVLLFSIPNGVQLIYLSLTTGLIAGASYYGFTYSKKPLSSSVLITGIFFLIVFTSHTIIISSPQKFGVNFQGDELVTFTTEVLQEIAEMDPVEFVKTDTGREIAVQLYDTSIFVSQEELEYIVKENPTPLKEVQRSLLSTNPFADDPYSYIIGVYTHSFINFLRKE